MSYILKSGTPTTQPKGGNERNEKDDPTNKNTHKHETTIPVQTPTIEPETTCYGCLEDQPNQQAHMEIGGCLYFEYWILDNKRERSTYAYTNIKRDWPEVKITTLLTSFYSVFYITILYKS